MYDNILANSECLCNIRIRKGLFHKAIAQSGCLKIENLENPAQKKGCLEAAMKFTNTQSEEDFKNKMMTMS